jgi:GntR family transcriptional regulator
MAIRIPLHVDQHSPIPIRRQLAEQLKHVIDSGGVPREQPLPSIRELAGFLGINPNTVARVVEDLKRDGYVEARRGKGVFVATAPPARPAPDLRQRFLRDAVIQAAALGMTAEDLSVGVLSLAGVRPEAIQGAVEVLLVECSPPELEFYARELEAHLPVRVDKVLLDDLPASVRRRKPAGRWDAAVTSFSHLPEVERLLGNMPVPVIALLAEAHLETLHRLARLPAGTRVGVVSDVPETGHNLEHSIANAGLPNITLVGSSPANGAALARLARRVDIVVCSTSAAEEVGALAANGVQVIVDDRALDQRAIALLATVLVGNDGEGMADDPPATRNRARPRPSRSSSTARRPAREVAARRTAKAR